MSHVVAGQTTIQQSDSVPTIAVIDPILGRELLRLRAFDSAEWYLVKGSSVLDRRWHQHAVANEFLAVQNVCFEIEPRNPIVNPDSCGERVCAESMPHLQFGENGPAPQRGLFAALLIAESGGAGLRDIQRPRHDHILKSVQIFVELPEIALVSLTGDNIGRAGECFPISLFHVEAIHRPALWIEVGTIEDIL